MVIKKFKLNGCSGGQGFSSFWVKRALPRKGKQPWWIRAAFRRQGNWKTKKVASRNPTLSAPSWFRKPQDGSNCQWHWEELLLRYATLGEDRGTYLFYRFLPISDSNSIDFLHILSIDSQPFLCNNPVSLFLFSFFVLQTFEICNMYEHEIT